MAENNPTWIKGVVRATAVKVARVRLRTAGRAGVRACAQGQRVGGDRPHPVAQTIINIKESWQEATQEEQRELVQIMLQEVACSIQEQQVTWIKPQPGFEILFKLVNDLQLNEKGRFFLKIINLNMEQMGIEA